MDSFIDSLCEYAPHAHLIIFSLLMLAGLCLPISEDILVLTGGAIASFCIPEQKFHLFAWIYAGAWTSAWEVYWIGRLLGPKLYNIKFFKHFINPKRVDKLHHYYEKFGVFTFIIGRFIPGGVRNALFLSSGLGKMPFLKFIIRDGFACLLSTTTLFSLGFVFAQNYKQIAKVIETYQLIVFSAIVLFVLILVALFYFRDKTTQDINE